MTLESIKYITSGPSLAAFLAAVVSAVVRRFLAREADVIRAIASTTRDSATREHLTGLVLERFASDTRGMSSMHRMELALKQLEERRRRLTLFFIFAAFASVCAAAIALVAVLK